MHNAGRGPTVIHHQDRSATAKSTTEPLLWSLFAAGGMVAALLIPVLIVFTGFVLAADVVSFNRLDDLFGYFLVEIVLFGMAVLVLVHAAHRLRFTLVDLGLKRFDRPIAAMCYGAALAGSVWAIIALFF